VGAASSPPYTSREAHQVILQATRVRLGFLVRLVDVFASSGEHRIPSFDSVRSRRDDLGRARSSPASQLTFGPADGVGSIFRGHH